MLSMTAAGRQVDVADREELKHLRQRPFPWQVAAYAYYDAVGESWFAANYIASAMSRLRIYPAIQLNPDEPPVAITSETLDPKDMPTDDEIALLLAATRRLTNSQGGLRDILRGFGLNGFLAGESFLIGMPDAEEDEEWEVHAITSLIVNPDDGNPIKLRTYPDDTSDSARDISTTPIYRIWRKHPQWPVFPDSPMRPGSEYLEDLNELRNMIRAAARSRMPSGIFGIPTEAGEGLIDDTEDENAEGNAKKDPLIDQLVKHFSEPIKNPKDAAAFVPFLLQLSGEDLDKVKKWDFAREIDKLAIELRTEARTAFASTVDLPSDVITGKQGLNDWSAWNVDEEGFRIHLAGHAELIVDGLTSAYLWPTLAKSQVENRRRFRFWYDPTELIARPNKVANAEKGHELWIISDSATRREMGFSESDAPDDEEVARRVQIAQAIHERTTVQAPSPIKVTEPENPDDGGAPGDGAPPGGVDLPGPSGPGDGGGAVTGSASPETLGRRLALIEQRLIDRLLTAIDAEMRRVLERAGSRVVTEARRASAGVAVRELVAGIPTDRVTSRVGRTMLAAMGLTDEELTAGAFVGLSSRWDLWVRRAQEQARTEIERAGSPIDTDRLDDIETRQADDRSQGWAVLAGALGALAATQLHEAEPTLGPGEGDASRLVQAGAVRAALGAAGGGPAVAPPTVGDRVSGEGRAAGLLSGQTVAELFAAAALELGGWVWVYGDPGSRSNPFEPHLALDGLEFATWEDSELVNDDSFPDTEFLFPGDHGGCQCTFARNGAAATDDEELPPTGDES